MSVCNCLPKITKSPHAYRHCGVLDLSNSARCLVVLSRRAVFSECSLIRSCNAKHAPHCTGHSVGAHCMVQAYNHPSCDKEKVLACVGLQPTVVRIGATPNGVAMYPLLKYFRTAIRCVLDRCAFSVYGDCTCPLSGQSWLAACLPASCVLARCDVALYPNHRLCTAVVVVHACACARALQPEYDSALKLFTVYCHWRCTTCLQCTHGCTHACTYTSPCAHVYNGARAGRW